MRSQGNGREPAARSCTSSPQRSECVTSIAFPQEKVSFARDRDPSLAGRFGGSITSPVPLTLHSPVDNQGVCGCGEQGSSSRPGSGDGYAETTSSSRGLVVPAGESRRLVRCCR